jgi:parallel beta-helix repeat protein
MKPQEKNLATECTEKSSLCFFVSFGVNKKKEAIMIRKRKMTLTGLFLIPLYLLLCAIPLYAAGQSSANYNMVADVMDVEGGKKTSGNYILLDSMGQGIFGGESASTSYILHVGFNGFQGLVPNEYYVDCVDGDDFYDGFSWQDAKKTIAAGIEALNGRSGTLYVAQGTYPENTTLTPGLTLLGGYDADTGQRDIETCITTIDGSYNGFPVVTGANNAAIEGFTIKNGFAQSGGGIYCNNINNFTIRNNNIESNYADKGGGIYISNYSTVQIEGNSIMANHAKHYTIGMGILSTADFAGGGIYVGDHSNPTITANTIRDNTSDEVGGGIYVEGYSNPTISGNYIEKNKATEDEINGSGGGICITGFCAPSLTNNMITENVAYFRGGGIYIEDQSQGSITNNTIADNSASSGGGINNFDSDPDIKNCIVWGNGDDLFGVTCDMISDSDIEDGDCQGTNGNIYCDPGFVGGGDYHLTSVSCCINKGTNEGAPSDDIDGEQRADGAVDIGADEYTNCSIIITSPAAGEDWWVGNTYTIRWNSWGAGDYVKIELGCPAGCWGYNWSTITSSTSNDGSYSWTVQGLVQNNCKIRICSTYNPDCCGESEPFDIEGNRPPTKPTITFSKNPIEPGESLQFCAHSTDPEGDAITYHWEIIYPNDGVNNIDSAHECTSAILSIPGSYTFYCTAEDEYGAKSGTAVAKLTVGTITVTSPQAGEDWKIGSTETIEWASSGVTGNVKIELGLPTGCGTSWVIITSSTSNTGSYDWTVEEPAQNNCTIRITSVDIPEISDESGSFDIVE